MKKVLLFDADGVVTLPEEVFSVVYSRSHGLDVKPFETFFQTEWNDFVTGKRDLKEHISDNPDLWQWEGSPDELLEYWFKSEDVRNQELVDLIEEMRRDGIPCYLATEQEKYRGEYIKNVMFKDLFDGFFITAEIGVKKSQPEFFEYVVEELNTLYEGLVPEDILYFDDSQSKVDAAKAVGLNAHLYTGVCHFKQEVQA